MKTKILKSLFFYFALIFSLNVNAQKVEIIFEDHSEKQYLKDINLYQFLHNLEIDIFYRTNMQNAVSENEKLNIYKNILKYLSPNNPIKVNIQQEKGPDFGVLVMAEITDKKDSLVWFLTNYHLEKEKVVKNLDKEQSYARGYLINKGKFVFYKSVYSEKIEAEKKKQGTFSLADFYLLDDREDNDEIALNLLESKVNNENANHEDIIYGKLTLSQYYMINENISKAKELIDETKKYIDSDTSLKKYNTILNICLSEYALFEKLFK